MNMAVNIEVKRGKNENNSSVLKRFTRRVQESGILRTVKGKRYETRTPSSNLRKKNKLVLLEKKTNTQRMIKMGKLNPSVKKGRRG